MAVIEAIATTYLEADAASVTFSSLGSYEHLQIRLNARTDAANTRDPVGVRFNSDSGTNYSYHTMYGYASSATAAAVTGATSIYTWRATGASVEAAEFGSIVIDILDYRNASKNTTLQSVGGMTSTEGTSQIDFASGLWDSTAAVTAISLHPSWGTNFTRGSEFTLYGLNSA
jgi:hypothetical protein